MSNTITHLTLNTDAEHNDAAREATSSQRVLAASGTVAATFELKEEEIRALLPCPVVRMASPYHWEAEKETSLLAASGVRVLITDVIPSNRALAGWKAGFGGVLLLLVFQEFVPAKVLNRETAYNDRIVTAFFDRRTVTLTEALALAEAAFTREHLAKPAETFVRATPSRAGASVLVAGAGIVGLMTAFELQRRGYKVEVVERTADPRMRAPWSQYGCTHGGENARMFSLTECDNYHDRSPVPGEKLHGHIARPVDELGWEIGKTGQYMPADGEWTNEFLRVPIWLADHYNDDIFDLNHQSFALWKAMIDEHPELFEGIGFKDGLLRICKTEAYHEKQVRRQKKVRAFIRELDRDRLASEYPALAAGCANREIHAGIEVEGFTVNIHDYAKKLINHLEMHGVSFRWNTTIDEIATRDGVVVGLRHGDTLMTSDHYFISAGAYARHLLDTAASNNKIHGVLGAWISFPNRQPKLQRSLKISREGHIAGSGNIILARNERQEEILIFGSGFGYVGREPSNICDDQLEQLFRSMESYIRGLFPEAYSAALESGELQASRKYCIRPWTASSLGIFEMRQASSGTLIVASGHNTGGFAQSTAIAAATLDAIEGRSHPMHSLYHPNRFDHFWRIFPH
ncbi:FAD-binding oxidoreductase [Rhizobium sp. CNPSo 4039]|uniref:NAD(P)/FAD-dependent oxidoreductase n=1 Tax=Rhizobium sp. CNPSo 4039 TaxID=3021409 RepID=UPI00254DFD2C|nr:FAD-binding oxidoreductase [Rhizobium sp. CNPSo 4039]MDK4717628.1 FAD-binding oxidoreductase [Rhizobium sp. CNPSo 4039]